MAAGEGDRTGLVGVFVAVLELPGEKGGPPLWDEFMDELREQHLGTPRPAGSESAFHRLQVAYEAEMAKAG